MGVSSSYLNYRKSSESSIESETTRHAYSTDGIGDYDFSLLDDLLIDILSFVSTKDLVFNCRLVCKEWKDLIDGHSIWKIKCQREGKFIPSVRFDKIPEHYYEKIYIHNPYGRNLLKNPYGEEGLDKWVEIETHVEDGFLVENPPQGAEAVPSEIGVQYCFATTYVDCTKYQYIDLLSVGVSKEVLQLKTTKIEIGEWYAARFDCASEYRLKVLLLDENFRVEDQDTTVVFSLDYTVDEFEFYHREEQWVGKEWHKITHTFEDVGAARYVYFQHSGRDKQFWAGHYGSKMTGAFVKVIV